MVWVHRQIEYAPGPFAGRGGVSWCHLLYPHRSFRAPPQIRLGRFPCQSKFQCRIWRRQGGGLSACAVTGAPDSLTALCSRCLLTTAVVTTSEAPARGTSVEWISLSSRPSHTDRWLSAFYGLNSYLSSRCLIAIDYTLPEKRVKKGNSHIIHKST